jgi:hypothetical protein
VTLVATPTLRWVPSQRGDAIFKLQQWWAPDVPGFMRSDNDGEWRDVPTIFDPPPVTDGQD